VRVRTGRLSPLAAVAVVATILLLAALFVVVAMVAVPVALLIGLGYAGVRSFRRASPPVTLGPSAGDGDGRQNVRVLRNPPQETVRQP